MNRLPYKQLTIWQKGIELTLLVYATTQNLPKEEMFNLKSQMRSAALSVPSNIAEGSQRNSDKEFAHFLSIAIGSLAELETQRIVANRLSYLSEEKNQLLEQRIDELRRMIFKFRQKLVIE